jgi:hypothetical protein
VLPLLPEHDVDVLALLAEGEIDVPPMLLESDIDVVTLLPESEIDLLPMLPEDDIDVLALPLEGTVQVLLGHGALETVGDLARILHLHDLREVPLERAHRTPCPLAHDRRLSGARQSIASHRTSGSQTSPVPVHRSAPPRGVAGHSRCRGPRLPRSRPPST